MGEEGGFGQSVSLLDKRRRRSGLEEG